MNKMVYIINMWKYILKPLEKICIVIFSIISFVSSIFGIVQFFSLLRLLQMRHGE